VNDSHEAHRAAVLSNPPEVSKVSPVLRRYLLIMAVILIAVAIPPAIPATAGADPAAFINISATSS